MGETTCRGAGPLAILAILAVPGGAPLRASVADPGLHDAVDRAIARVYPALVRIYVVTAYYSDGREVKGEASGSGGSRETLRVWENEVGLDVDMELLRDSG